MEPRNESNEVLSHLLGNDFDAIQYLNDTLPSLSLGSQGSSAKQSRTAQLQSSAAGIQGQASKLNTFNVRTSTELTILTDEILRSGNRLAYEVEVLRSDANSLYDLLSDTLRDDIRQFVREESGQGALVDVAATTVGSTKVGRSKANSEPEFMQQLRELGHVKARLEKVIHVFGESLKWPIPPSDVSMASQLISVASPEFGVASTAEDDKARATIRQYREEMIDLLNSEGGGYAGLQVAQERLQEFQDLSLVWKGTVEERARNRVVDGFNKIVDDRKRALEAQQSKRLHVDSARNSTQPSRSGTPSLPAGGLFGNLRKLRDEIYLD